MNELKLIWSIIAFFLISQLLGIYGGMVILQDYTKNPYVDSMVVTSDTSNPMNAALFAGYIILGAVLMLLLIKIFKIYDIVFQLMEFFLIAVASSIVFYAIFRIFFGYELSMLLAIAAGLLLSALKHFAPWLKNAAAIAATGGVGILFGISLAPVPAILFLIFLAIYDYVSVFITKHMVEFANFIVKKDLAFTVTAKGMVEGKERRIDLGTGDLIAPIILEVSVLSLSPVATVFVFIGALVSLAVFMYLVWERKVVLPALPPLVFGMLLFFLIGLLGGFY